MLDSNVGRVRDDARTDVEKVVEEVAAIPLPVPSRKVRDQHMPRCSAVMRYGVEITTSKYTRAWDIQQ